jgi:6-phosphofructokinase 1
MPLIGEDWVSVPMVKGLLRFAQISQKFARRKLAEYLPQTYRMK